MSAQFYLRSRCLNNIMQFIEQIKNYYFYHNTGYDYFLAVVVFIGLIILLKIFQAFILSRLKNLAKKTKTDFDDILIEIFRKVRPPFYFFVSLYFGIKMLTLPELLVTTINILFIIAIVYEVIRAMERLVDYFLDKYLERIEKTEESRETSISMIKSLKLIIRIGLWVLGIIMILGNLGVNITSLIASLGIGGIAIALALQNVLSDIFSSFSIYLDKPFVVGDFIQVGTDRGHVEKIGLKTTRIRTPLGEELIISNQELTTVRVQNFRRMEKRRVSVNLGVVYATSSEKLENIPKIIKQIIDKTDQAEYDRCNFASFGDSSLNFELVYYVNSRDYKEYMNTNEKVNLEIYKRFEKEGIEFAYPTQTIILEK